MKGSFPDELIKIITNFPCSLSSFGNLNIRRLRMLWKIVIVASFNCDLPCSIKVYLEVGEVWNGKMHLMDRRDINYSDMHC